MRQADRLMTWLWQTGRRRIAHRGHFLRDVPRLPVVSKRGELEARNVAESHHFIECRVIGLPRCRDASRWQVPFWGADCLGRLAAFWEKVHWGDHDTSNESGDCFGRIGGVVFCGTESGRASVLVWREFRWFFRRFIGWKQWRLSIWKQRRFIGWVRKFGGPLDWLAREQWRFVGREQRWIIRR